MIASAAVTRAPLYIGRTDECGILLPSTGVSRRHASVQLQRDGRVVLNDEGSANGVRVDGQFISGPTLIDERHRIEISEFVLQLESAEASVEEVDRRHVPAAMETIAAGAHLRRDPLEATGPQTTEQEPEELDTALEPRASAAAELAGSKLRLTGKGGPYEGTVFRLDKALLGVGRTPENDIALDDPSISRRHAQIRLSVGGDSFTVLDLRSSNGTFVDGQGVKRAECRPGQVLRFGDVAFKVGREQQRDPVQRAPRRRLLVGGALLVLVVGGIGGVAYWKRPAGQKQVITPEQKLRELQADVQRSIDEARRRIQQREWTRAVRALDLAKSKDPLNAELPKLRAKALEELEHERTFKRAMELFALGNRENLIKAREIFETVPASSVYHREVRYKVKSIDERFAEDYRIEGVSRCDKSHWAECAAALCEFFELMPAEVAVPGEGHLRALLRDAEKRLAHRKGFRSCQSRRFLEGGKRQGSGTDLTAQIGEKYSVDELRDVVLTYVEGKLDAALKRLVRAANDRRLRPHLVAINEINRQLLIIKGKYQEGYSAYRERDVERARRDWDLVLAADGALLPAGVESFYRREVTRALGDLYFELGDEQFKAGRHRPAFELWSKGKVVDPRHERVLNGLLQLETEADGFIKAGQRLAAEGRIAEARAKLTLALDITESGRRLHADAQKALGELGQ